MTALLRPQSSSAAAPAPVSGQPGNFLPGIVLRLDGDDAVWVHCAGEEHRAAVASHIPGLLEGQAVLVAVTGTASPAGVAQAGASNASMPLVIAAWPMPGAPMTPPWHFDRGTGTLALAATSLELSAVNSVQLTCGDARLQFTRDGAVETRGQSITSAAIETHRIEGGSIELN